MARPRRPDRAERHRWAPPDELERALLRARRLWDAFLSTCNARDRRLLAGDAAGAEAAARTLKRLDVMLTDAEAEVRRLDAKHERPGRTSLGVPVQ